MSALVISRWAAVAARGTCGTRTSAFRPITCWDPAVVRSSSRRPGWAAGGSTTPCARSGWSGASTTCSANGPYRDTPRAGCCPTSSWSREMIADSWMEIEAFRLLTLQTAWKIDQHNDYKAVRADISAVKAMMQKVLHDVSARALQLHGSLGTTHEMPFVSYLVESFVLGLADGPTEVHKVTLARLLLKDQKPAPDMFPSAHLLRLREAAEAKFADKLAGIPRS